MNWSKIVANVGSHVELQPVACLLDAKGNALPDVSDDSYAITEAYMKEIPIPAPSDKKTVKQIIDLVDALDRKPFDLTRKDEVQEMEEKLQALVDEALAAVPA